YLDNGFPFLVFFVSFCLRRRRHVASFDVIINYKSARNKSGGGGLIPAGGSGVVAPLRTPCHPVRSGAVHGDGRSSAAFRRRKRWSPPYAAPGALKTEDWEFPRLSTGMPKEESDQSTSTKEAKEKRNLLDNASNLLTNLLSGGNLGTMPTAEGAVTDLFGRPLFFSLYDWFLEHGSVYKLAFGPKAFVVVSDPIVARYILRENAFCYDKGVLADILEPIMGKGLIPADLDTWKQRRRVIAPGFHALFLEAMAKVFTDCSERTISKFDTLLENEASSKKEIELDIEAEFSSLALDVIGLGVFNYDFGSVTKESPVIKAVYGTLFEAEHRSTFYIPYWNLPLARWIVPRQRKFHNDLKIINDCLDQLIKNAKDTRKETDVEELQKRDYSALKDASLLRFLVDMRGADVDDRQLRDDLMTMLIAGHETTAAVLTWSIFLLAQNPSKMRKAQLEVDSVLGGGRITFENIRKLE
ncbi:hypothetical protein Taro_017190, partial [Colocasia esculenta]|nr:hypothetical protein [Colocasia esculenta]